MARRDLHLLLALTVWGCRQPSTPSRDIAEPQATVTPSAPPPTTGAPTPQLEAPPRSFDGSGIDALVAKAIEQKRLPGCVVTIGTRYQILFQRAYGERATLPTAEPMTLDTRFDLASLTKSVATSIAVLQQVEAGSLRLDARASTYLPELLTGAGVAHKRNITLRHLMLHSSGLPAITPLSDYEQAGADLFTRILKSRPLSKPGTTFLYSDVGYIALGEIVARTAGTDLAAYMRTHVFEPLGMSHTSFGLAVELREQAAPTERGVQRDGQWIRGEVHDPRAYRLGGIAGNAGVFSTANDLSRLARALLNGGSIDGQRVLSPRSVAVMTEPHMIGDSVRALGWDIDSRYSNNGGELLSPQAYGHGGFTGTSLWIDPAKDLFVLFLSNAVHPDGSGNVIDLAGAIANYSVSNVTDAPLQPSQPVKVGIDVLRADNFSSLAGKAIGLITNESARGSDGNTTLAHFRKAKNLSLKAVFTPEHGLTADHEGVVANQSDPARGVPVYSLFGPDRKPTAAMLQGIDTLVFDLQDVGVRFYTYASTLVKVLEAAREHNVGVVVLDRPNPLGGIAVEGPLQDEGVKTFVNYHRLPVRHGMTMGELARLLNVERDLHASLEVVAMTGWQPHEGFESTGLTWTAPSPNLRTATQAWLYPALGLLESTNVSVGRGTDLPFEIIGAPWLDATKLAARLRARFTDMTFVPMQITPTTGPHQNVTCNVVHISLGDRARFQPVTLALVIAQHLALTHPEWLMPDLYRTLASRQVMSALRASSDVARLEALWSRDLIAFLARRQRFLIYPR